MRGYCGVTRHNGPMAALPSVSYSITVRLELPAAANAVSELTHAIEQAGGMVTALDVTGLRATTGCAIDVTCAAARHRPRRARSSRRCARLDGVTIGKVSDRTFLMHLGGKIEIESKVPIRNRDDLSLVYTPGVARVCLAIADNPDDARRLTIKRNTRRGRHRRLGRARAWATSARSRRCR